MGGLWVTWLCGKMMMMGPVVFGKAKGPVNGWYDYLSSGWLGRPWVQWMVGRAVVPVSSLKKNLGYSGWFEKLLLVQWMIDLNRYGSSGLLGRLWVQWLVGKEMALSSCWLVRLWVQWLVGKAAMGSVVGW